MHSSFNNHTTSGSLNIFSQAPSLNNSIASNPYASANTRIEETLLHPQTTPLRCRASRSQQQSPANATPAFVYALDHLSTKLKIPMTAVETTKALTSDGLVPGICRLYMDGQCRQGVRCYQVHADPDVVTALRKEAHECPSCCHVHGAKCSYVGFPLALTVTLEGTRDPPHCPTTTISNTTVTAASLGSQAHPSSLPQVCPPQDATHGAVAVSPSTLSSKQTPLSQPLNTKESDSYPAVSAREMTATPAEPQSETTCSTKPSVVPLSHLNPTSFLWKLYREEGRPHLRVPISRVCRDHRKGLCRFGEECSFLHVCRELPLDHYHGMDEAAGGQTPSHHARGQPVSRWMNNGGGGGSSSMPSTGQCPSRAAVNSSFSSCNYPPGQNSFVGNSLSSSMTGLRVGGHGNMRSYGASVTGEEGSVSQPPLLRPLAHDGHRRHRHHTSERDFFTSSTHHKSSSNQ